MKKANKRNFGIVLHDIIAKFTVADNEEQKIWVKWLNDSLDELRDEDFFGTEAQNDPRGDNRTDVEDEVIEQVKVMPMGPREASEKIITAFPDFVIGGINAAINRHYLGRENFTIEQKEIIKEILKLAPENTTKNDLFDNHWLDFENLYRKLGWSVTYDKPGWDETYEPFFKFKANKK